MDPILFTHDFIPVVNQGISNVRSLGPSGRPACSRPRGHRPSPRAEQGNRGKLVKKNQGITRGIKVVHQLRKFDICLVGYIALGYIGVYETSN